MALLADLAGDDDWGLEELGSRRGLLDDLAARSGRGTGGATEDRLGGSVQWGGSHGASGIDMDEQVRAPFPCQGRGCGRRHAGRPGEAGRQLALLHVCRMSRCRVPRLGGGGGRALPFSERVRAPPGAQEAVLARYFKADKVKKYLKQQREVESAWAELKVWRARVPLPEELRRRGGPLWVRVGWGGVRAHTYTCGSVRVSAVCVGGDGRAEGVRAPFGWGGQGW